MNLFIDGIEKPFNIEKLEITTIGVMLESKDLVAEIELTSIQEPESPAPPPAPKEVTYIETSKMGKYTREQYEAMDWTVDQMVAEGLLEAVIEESLMPSPPAKEAQVDTSNVLNINGTQYEMTPKAAGASYEDFIDSKWSNDDLIKEGYLAVVEGAPEPEASWPKKENDTWVDSAGTFFDPETHSMTKAKVPGVTKKGEFCKRRNLKKVAPSAPPAPNTSEDKAIEETAPPAPKKETVPSAPSTSAPSAPSAPAATGQADEPLDAELESLIKDWG